MLYTDIKLQRSTFKKVYLLKDVFDLVILPHQTTNNDVTGVNCGQPCTGSSAAIWLWNIHTMVYIRIWMHMLSTCTMDVLLLQCFTRAHACSSDINQMCTIKLILLVFF